MHTHSHSRSHGRTRTHGKNKTKSRSKSKSKHRSGSKDRYVDGCKSDSERGRIHAKRSASRSERREAVIHAKSHSLEKKLPHSTSPEHKSHRPQEPAERRRERPSSPRDDSKRPEERVGKAKKDVVVKVDKTAHMWYEEEGQLKGSVHIVLPEYLIPHIIGEDKATINSIVNRSGCIIRFLSNVCGRLDLVGVAGLH